MNKEMNQVLILTKNILSEQDVQQKLQALNYEVYCSAALFDYYHQQSKSLDILNYFHYVILSESLCESEVKEVVPLLRRYSVKIIRKVELRATATDQDYLTSEQINAIISSDDSIDELRECLYALGKREDQAVEQPSGKVIQMSGKVSSARPHLIQDVSMMTEQSYRLVEVFLHLSQTETRILSTLIQAEGQIVTREELCQQIWNEEASKSHLASLSSTVTRIKSKFEQTRMREKAIHTMWGKGYRINQELLERVRKDEDFSRIVMNG